MIFKRLNLEIKELTKENPLFPQNLLSLPDCPDKLYVIGDEAILNEPSVAIVGTRSSSEEGNSIAQKIAQVISSKNIIVVSGAAFGIDTNAHKGTFNNGKTIAYIAGGFDATINRSRISLIKQIIDNGGAIVSEYSNDTSPQAFTFLDRNRLIAAHSSATIIVEAPFKSGAMNTAKHARQLNKKIYCIPWNLKHENGKGCNNLIYEGARILLSVSEVINDTLNNNQLSFADLLDNEANPDFIEKQYLHYYSYLKEFSPASFNSICSFFSTIPVSTISSDLIMMEINGYIMQDASGNYVLHTS